MPSLKQRLYKTHLAKFVKRIIRPRIKQVKFPGSKAYWELRYQSNRTSGAGSYGRLAEFKAEFLNDFVKQHEIRSVIEFGMGDGNQLSLAEYPQYIGYDVSKKAVTLCKHRFKEDTTKDFRLMEDLDREHEIAELVISLDVIYHLVEDYIFHDYMTKLFDSASRFVIIYSSNYDDHFADHVKCRKFTDWTDSYVKDTFSLHDIIKNKYPFHEDDPDNTSMADFYIFKMK